MSNNMCDCCDKEEQVDVQEDCTIVTIICVKCGKVICQYVFYKNESGE